MRVPSRFTMNDIKTHDVYYQDLVTRTFKPARCIGWRGFYLLRRLKLAWKVFKGEYDALDWEQE
jgi:hypothetical protein